MREEIWPHSVSSYTHGAAFDGIAFLSGHHQAAAHFERGSGIGIRRLQLHSLLVARCQELGVRLAWGSRVHVVSKQPLSLNGEPCVLSLRDRGGWPILPCAPGDRPGPGKDLQPPLRDPMSLPGEAVVPHGGGALGRTGPSLHHPRRRGRNLRRHRRPRSRHQNGRGPRQPAGPAQRVLRAPAS